MDGRMDSWRVSKLDFICFFLFFSFLVFFGFCVSFLFFLVFYFVILLFFFFFFPFIYFVLYSAFHFAPLPFISCCSYLFGFYSYII